MERCLSIVIKRRYLPSSIFFTNLCGSGGSGLGMRVTFWGILASFPVLSSYLSLTSTTSSSPLIIFFTTDGIGVWMVCLHRRVVTSIQFPSLFGFWTVLLRKVHGWCGFTVKDNWAIWNYRCLIEIAWASTFFPKLSYSLLNYLVCS